MKTKNISFKKAALPVFGVLIAAIIALTSVTYAWFTSGTTATVSPINVGVEAAGGLQIAMGEADKNFEWKSSIDLNLAEQTLSPVSTSGIAQGENGARYLDFFSARYTDTYDKISETTKVEEAKYETSFIKFDLYFRNPELTAKSVNIVGTTVTSLAGQSNEAVRIAFIRQAKISSASSNQKPGAFASISDEGSKFGEAIKVFEPNATSHTDNGITDYEKNTGREGENTKYDYRGVEAASEGTKMYDRYTGNMYDKYTPATRVYSDDYDFGAYKVYASNAGVTKFRTWDITDDFTDISPEEAAGQRIDGKTIYTKEIEDTKTVFKEFTGEINPEGEYYIFTPVDLYQETEKSELAAKDDVLTDNYVTTYGATASDIYFDLDAQSVTKVTVYIWLEGQDADCNNTVAGYQFDVNLSFSSVIKTQA